MMTEVFIGSIAFSVGLIAFTAGAWLTVNSNNNPNGGRFVGLVITLLAILSLVFTSYNVAKVVFMQNTMQKMMYMRNMNNVKHMKMKEMMKHKAPKKQQDGNASPSSDSKQ
jgi:thiol:disulfide interchange protein